MMNEIITEHSGNILHTESSCQEERHDIEHVRGTGRHAPSMRRPRMNGRVSCFGTAREMASEHATMSRIV